MLISTIFAGFGGQGVMVMGYALAFAGMRENRYVTYLPAYGAEVRGGTANCTVSISDEEIASPIASEPKFIVVVNTPSLISFENRIQSGGQVFINSSLINVEPNRGDVESFLIPASDIAKELGNVKATNMVMLGAFVKKIDSVKINTVIDCLPEIFPGGKKKVVELSERALMRGYEHL
jgi:2-oxoglutarate ferredoxin oxidoreductase subunit gamma